MTLLAVIARPSGRGDLQQRLLHFVRNDLAGRHREAVRPWRSLDCWTSSRGRQAVAIPRLLHFVRNDTGRVRNDLAGRHREAEGRGDL